MHKTYNVNFFKMLQPLVLNGPSGAGKSTLLKKLMAKYENCFSFTTSHTTRTPRPGEQDGKDYHFVSREKMLQLINEKKFLEYAEFAGNIYGTSFEAVMKVLNSGKICVLDIEMEGVKSIKNSELNARFVFITAPSYEILERRLINRGTETEDKIRARMKISKIEMEFSKIPNMFDLIIVNDDLEVALRNLENFLQDDFKLLKTRK